MTRVQVSQSRSVRCFVAMPIRVHPDEAELYRDDEHWDHVYETLFAPAIEQAGMIPIKPVAEGSHMIHAEIIKNVTGADMVLVDLSSHNPNVFFEFGVRTAANKPIAVVRDEHTSIPFDTSGVNTHKYLSGLHGWTIANEIEALANHLRRCVESCKGQNPLWRQFGLRIKAEAPEVNESASDARLDLLVGGMDEIRHELSTMRRRIRSLDSRSDSRSTSVHDFESEVMALAGSEEVSGIARGPGFAEIHSPDPVSRSLATRIGRLAESHGLDLTFRIAPHGDGYDPLSRTQPKSRDSRSRD